jgi:2'-5' RNA ligase
MPRLFTGIEIPADVGLSLSLVRGGLSGAHWIDPADYHVTLRFIGDVDNAVANDFAELLDGVRRPAFDVAIGELHAFGGKRPHAIVATVEPSAALVELQAEHERIARRAGLPPETRKFAPHVTLARLRGVSAQSAAGWLAARGGMRPLAFPVRRSVLFSSRASTGGGPYLAEAAYPLD